MKYRSSLEGLGVQHQRQRPQRRRLPEHLLAGGGQRAVRVRVRRRLGLRAAAGQAVRVPELGLRGGDLRPKVHVGAGHVTVTSPISLLRLTLLLTPRYLSVGHPEVVVGLVVAVSEKTAQLAEVEPGRFDVAHLWRE